MLLEGSLPQSLVDNDSELNDANVYMSNSEQRDVFDKGSGEAENDEKTEDSEEDENMELLENVGNIEMDQDEIHIIQSLETDLGYINENVYPSQFQIEKDLQTHLSNLPELPEPDIQTDDSPTFFTMENVREISPLEYATTSSIPNNSATTASIPSTSAITFSSPHTSLNSTPSIPTKVKKVKKNTKNKGKTGYRPSCRFSR